VRAQLRACLSSRLTRTSTKLESADTAKGKLAGSHAGVLVYECSDNLVAAIAFPGSGDHNRIVEFV